MIWTYEGTVYAYLQKLPHLITALITKNENRAIDLYAKQTSMKYYIHTAQTS